jgi:cytosine permease
MATFADSGTMTADFTRWSKNGKQAVIATATAFPIASLIAQLSGGILVAAGAIANATVAGGDFTPILTGGGSPLLDILVVVFVVVNLGSVCTHCLYNGALGWSHLVRGRMRVLTLVLGVIGVVLAVLGVWSLFVNWLVFLGVIVPPLGAVLIGDQIVLARRLPGRQEQRFRPTAFIAWGIGAAAALVVHLFAPAWSDAVTGLVVGLVAYLLLEQVKPKQV